MICLLLVSTGSLLPDLKGSMKGDKTSRSEGLLRKSSPSLDTLNFLDVAENVWLKLIATNLKLISWWRCSDHHDRSSVSFSYISLFLNVDDLSVALWISGLQIQSLFAPRGLDTRLSSFTPSLVQNISSNSFIAVSCKMATSLALKSFSCSMSQLLQHSPSV